MHCTRFLSISKCVGVFFVFMKIVSSFLLLVICRHLVTFHSILFHSISLMYGIIFCLRCHFSPVGIFHSFFHSFVAIRIVRLSQKYAQILLTHHMRPNSHTYFCVQQRKNIEWKTDGEKNQRDREHIGNRFTHKTKWSDALWIATNWDERKDEREDVATSTPILTKTANVCVNECTQSTPYSLLNKRKILWYYYYILYFLQKKTTYF